jgi:ribosomal protein L37AE/L43A
MKISRIKSNYEGLSILLKKNFLEKIDVSLFVCKHCSHPNNKFELKVEKNLWKCLNCDRNNKYDTKTEKTNTFYMINRDKLEKAIKLHLENAGLSAGIIDDDLYVVNQGKKIPILLLELNANTTSLIDWLKHPCIVLYLFNESKKKASDIYSKPNFIKLENFFETKKQDLIDCINQLSVKYEESEIMKITIKIRNFSARKQWGEFEKESASFFNDFKNNEQKIKDMLAFLKINAENPTGTKFVCIGGNYPADIIPINLSDYINELLKVENNKGYDTKLYSRKLTKSVFNEKCNTNKGRKLVFITNTCANKDVWEEVIKAKQNSGEWYHFILDLDLLKMLLYFIGYEQYFN